MSSVLTRRQVAPLSSDRYTSPPTVGRARPPPGGARRGRGVVQERVDHARIAAGDIEIAAADRPGRQPVPQLRPGPAGVDGLVDPARRPADDLPQARVEDLRVGRVHHEVDGARAVVNIQRSRPRRAAVGRLEHAPLGVRRPRVPHRGDVDDVGVLRVDDDLADVMRVGEAHRPPRPARVRRLEDPGAGKGGTAVSGLDLACPHPDDVRVGGRDGDVADGERGLVLEDGFERHAVVGRLPDVAASRPDVERARARARGRDGLDAPALERGPERLPVQRPERRRVAQVEMGLPRAGASLGRGRPAA